MNTTVQEQVSETASTVVNGVDLETLMGTVKAIQADPELGVCHFRATNKWLNGNRTCFQACHE